MQKTSWTKAQEVEKQGYKDSNLEMTESESVALPFGDSPISDYLMYYTLSIPILQYPNSKFLQIILLVGSGPDRSPKESDVPKQGRPGRQFAPASVRLLVLLGFGIGKNEIVSAQSGNLSEAQCGEYCRFVYCL